MSGKNEKVDVFLRGISHHGKSAVRYDLRAVYDDQGIVFMSHTGKGMDVIDVSRHIGCGSNGNIFDRVFVQQPFHFIEPQPSVFINLGINGIAPVSPGQIIRIMLHARGKDHIVLIGDQGGRELVQPVRRVRAEKRRVQFGIGVDEIQNRLPGFFIKLGDSRRLLSFSLTDVRICAEFFNHLFIDILKGRRCGCVVKADGGDFRSVGELHKGIHPIDFPSYGFHGIIFFRFRRRGRSASSQAQHQATDRDDTNKSFQSGPS